MRLIDVSAVLPGAGTPARGSAREARRRGDETIGVTMSIRCAAEPARLDSREAIAWENAVRRAETLAAPERTAWYVAVSPADPAHARREIAEGREAIGIELSGPLYADPAAFDDIVAEALRLRFPIRSTSAEVVASLAARHAGATFILAQLGDGGRWHSALAAVAPLTNVMVDISGRVAERGMLDAVVFEAGPRRVLWGTGGAMETGLAQLRALGVIGPGDEVVEAIRWKNAARIFSLGGGTGT